MYGSIVVVLVPSRGRAMFMYGSIVVVLVPSRGRTLTFPILPPPRFLYCNVCILVYHVIFPALLQLF
jgi:hypothetical protein